MGLGVDERLQAVIVKKQVMECRWQLTCPLLCAVPC